MMDSAPLIERFRSRVRYKQAASWQKPWIDPARCWRNQWRKIGLANPSAGTPAWSSTFHMPHFGIVTGEAVSDEIAAYGIFEPELTDAFLRLIKPGQVVVDIGMHLGYFTTLMAILVGSTGRVHSFEPTPSTRETAERNTSQFPQITVHPFAVWSSPQTIAFRDYGPQWMAFNTLAKGRLDREPVPAREIQVQTTTLDHFRQELAEKIAFVKIDAESAERQILSGATELLKKDRPILSVEVGHDEGESHALVQDLARLDYVPWEMRAGKFVPHQAQADYGYDNLIFAPATRDLTGD